MSLENKDVRNWQSKENKRAFERNKELAAIENQYNVEQWYRENEYNDPVSQVQRFVAAGINPNLVAGQVSSGNSSQLSGSLSAGTPYEPVNGALGYDKRDKIDMAMKGLAGLFDRASQLGKVKELSDPLYREQVKEQRLVNDGLEHDNALKESELRQRKYDEGIRDFMRTLNMSPDAINDYLTNPEWKNTTSLLGTYDVQKKIHELASMNADARQKKLNLSVDEAIKDEKIKALNEQYKLTAEESKSMLKAVSMIVAGRVAEAQSMIVDASFKTAEQKLKEANGFMNFVLMGSQVLGNIFGK